MDHRKGKTRKLHLYLVSIYGVPSPGIQSPSSSLVLLMGPVPNLGGLTPLKSRPYQLELVSDQPAPEPYPSLILFPGAFPRPILSQVPLLGPALNSGRLHPLRNRPHQPELYPSLVSVTWVPSPGPRHLTLSLATLLGPNPNPSRLPTLRNMPN